MMNMILEIKKITALAFIISAELVSAQVAIGKQTINGTQTILDFDDNTANTKGIILSAVTPLPTPASTANGTFLFDRTDNKVKVLENNTWKSLSDSGNSAALAPNNNTSAETAGKVIIGAKTSAANGILVLEANNKAMILPKISNPHLTVPNPYPGMICYDTASKSLAVFDGSKWNYWK